MSGGIVLLSPAYGGINLYPDKVDPSAIPQYLLSRELISSQEEVKDD